MEHDSSQNTIDLTESALCGTLRSNFRFSPFKSARAAPILAMSSSDDYGDKRLSE
ncbi:MAG: hypothetical protein LCH38_01870 [Proteobacteria bacterium]|nr:hypothetical protein [Pseudomonadota bacterium]